MANIGINLVEVDGRATPSIQGASTSVAGFLMRTERGVPGKVRNVTNMSEFIEYFGGFRNGSAPYYGPYAIKGFFENGGTNAYVARIVETDATKISQGPNPPQAPQAATAATKTITQLTKDIVFTAAYRGDDDPGDWGNNLKIQLDPSDASGMFDLTVYYQGKVVEVWDHLPCGAASEIKVNDPFSGSKFIRLTYPAALASVAAQAAVALAGGHDDNMPQSQVEIRAQNMLDAGGTGVFDTFDVQLVACPEATDANTLTAGKDYAAARGDCIFLAAAPDTADPTAAKTFGKAKKAANVYAALYYPFVRSNDPIGTTLWVNPIGHVMGVYARTERERGIWKSPAGINAQVRGVLDIRTHMTDVKHTDLVKDGGVNAIRYFPGQGIVIDSGRTLSSNPLWAHVNVRLLFNFVKSSLKNGLRWVVHEPNDEQLWNKVKHNSVVPFLSDLWRRGAFGPGERNDVFSVKIDKENNPPANIQQGILNVEVYFYPSRPAETFIITVGQQEGGPSASES
jgi:phage tail sheath protein FI